ncbi:MAG: branched-chain amino acid ABC transporter permease [Hyphomicrobiales bacterium]|nr:branched-chain amino acid ABC transporter permease [Hyphomicrobiales bacterium]
MQDVANAFVLLANFVLIPGVAYGAQLALGALGVTLIYGVLRFANFAHGDLMAFGTMLCVLLTWWLQSLGVGIAPLPTAFLALPLAIAGAAALSLVFDRVVYRYHRRQQAPAAIFMIASVGVMFVINGIVRLTIGPDDQRFADGARFIIRARDFEALTGLDEGLSIRVTQALTLGVAIAAMVALFLFLNRTRAGKAMRAYSDNPELALLSGIDPDRVVRNTWIIAAALATIAGVLFGLDKSFKPFTYFQLVLPIFAAAIVGGIGNPVGAVLGGFLIAFSEVTIAYAYKRFLTYLVPPDWAPTGLVQFLSTDYKLAVSFVILVIVLLVRPTGILRGQTT